MSLGYCVVFDHGEQGWAGLIVVVTNSDLDKCVRLVEALSGYPANHERYTQQVFDLTKMYHELALGMISDKELDELKNYSPEAVESILHNSPVEYTAQAYTPLGTRSWINRQWGFVTDALYTHLKEISAQCSTNKSRKI